MFSMEEIPPSFHAICPPGFEKEERERECNCYSDFHISCWVEVEREKKKEMKKQPVFSTRLKISSEFQRLLDRAT